MGNVEDRISSLEDLAAVRRSDTGEPFLVGFGDASSPAASSWPGETHAADADGGHSAFCFVVMKGEDFHAGLGYVPRVVWESGRSYLPMIGPIRSGVIDAAPWCWGYNHHEAAAHCHHVNTLMGLTVRQSGRIFASSLVAGGVITRAQARRAVAGRPARPAHPKRRR